MRLSEHFTLEEFLFSQTAIRHKIPMDPPESVVKNLKHLVAECLEPLRVALGKPIRVTSGYRPAKLNTLIGGSKTSQHRFGRAADIVVPGVEPYDVMAAFLDLHRQYDQAIHEFGRWVHIGTADKCRFQQLTAYHDRAGRVKYVHGLHRIEGLDDEVW